MEVEVAYANTSEQYIIPIELSENSTILDAIQISNILKLCPEINLEYNKVGIYGVIANLETILKQNDRVEIYRPLPMDPMAKRFQRVKSERRKRL